jgi:hypothetical protein
MANTPNDYRDPKVTATDKPASRNWLWIALAAIAALILLAFVFGLFGGGDDEAVVIEEEPVEGEVIEEAPTE